MAFLKRPVVNFLTISLLAVAGWAQQAMASSTLDQFRHVGVMVHDDTQDGYRLSFQLMTQEEKRATLSSSKGKETRDGHATHHLMLILLSPDGRFVTDATVHFSIKAPDGSLLEAAAAPMASGYGADVDMRARGTYEMRADVSVDGRRLTDSFTYLRK